MPSLSCIAFTAARRGAEFAVDAADFEVAPYQQRP
jgi:hypothetical protein